MLLWHGTTFGSLRNIINSRGILPAKDCPGYDERLYLCEHPDRIYLTDAWHYFYAGHKKYFVKPTRDNMTDYFPVAIQVEVNDKWIQPDEDLIIRQALDDFMTAGISRISAEANTYITRHHGTFGLIEELPYINALRQYLDNNPDPMLTNFIEQTRIYKAWRRTWVNLNHDNILTPDISLSKLRTCTYPARIELSHFKKIIFLSSDLYERALATNASPSSFPSTIIPNRVVAANLNGINRYSANQIELLTNTYHLKTVEDQNEMIGLINFDPTTLFGGR